MSDQKRCEYCAEEIRVEAKRCPYCRSRIRKFERTQWHRGHGDARMAGVASALGHALSIPVGLIRLGFVVSCFFHLAGPLAYAVLWVVIPENLGRASALQRGLVKAESWAAVLAGEASVDAPPAQPSQAGGSLGSPTVLDGTDGER
jgi:phage shock protein C